MSALSDEMKKWRDEHARGGCERGEEFLSWCCCDLGYKEIAQRMDLSTRTVESYADILCNKIGVKSRIGLVIAALSMGLKPAE